jgi:hypothetical protein
LAEAFGADHIDETCAAMASIGTVDEAADTSTVKAAIRECDRGGGGLIGGIFAHAKGASLAQDPVLTPGD